MVLLFIHPVMEVTIVGKMCSFRETHCQGNYLTKNNVTRYNKYQRNIYVLYIGVGWNRDKNIYPLSQLQ